MRSDRAFYAKISKVTPRSKEMNGKNRITKNPTKAFNKSLHAGPSAVYRRTNISFLSEHIEPGQSPKVRRSKATY